MDNFIVMVEHHPAMTALITTAVISIFTLMGWLITHIQGNKNAPVNNVSAPVQEETKIVNSKWLELSGKQKELEKQGYAVAWSNPDKVEEHIVTGYEIVSDFDNTRNIRTKYINNSGQVLLKSRAGVK